MIELALLPQHLQVVPGGLGRCSLTLHTDDPEPTEYTLTIHGLDPGWYTFSVTRLVMVATADGPATLTLHPPPGVPEGIYPFEVIAIRLDDPDQVARLDALLVVDAAGAGTGVPPAESPAAQAVQLVRRVRREPERPAVPRWLMAVAALLFLAILGGAVALAMRPGSPKALPPRCESSGASPSACAASTPRGGGGTPLASPTALSVNPASGAIPPVDATTAGSGHAKTTGTVFSGMPDSPRQPVRPSAHTVTPTPSVRVSATRMPQSTAATVAPSPTARRLRVVALNGTGTPRVSPTASPRRVTTVTATETATSSPTATATATPTFTATPSATPTARPTLTPTATRTATHTATPVPSSTKTHTPTPTPPPTATPVPTSTPPPTLSPTSVPTATVPPLPTATKTTVPTPTLAITATPAAVALQYGFTVSSGYFTLRWEAVNAAGVTIDNHAMPVTGQELYPLRTHTYVLTAVGADGSQTAQVLAVEVVNPCLVLVNGQRVAVPTATCLNPASATPTAVPSYTPYPTSTELPTSTATLFPTDTATPWASITAGSAVTGTPATPGVGATPAFALTVFPTDTPTP
jgi:hypothetical protein